MQTQPYFVNDYGDRYLYAVNRNTFNQFGAANVFKRRFGDALFDGDCLTIVVGTDSGLLPRYVDAHGVGEGARFLFLELDELLPTIDSELAGESLDERILIRGQRPLGELLGDIHFSDYANIGAVRLIESLGVTDGYHSDYRSHFTAVKQELDAILWMHNVQLSNPSFVRRQLENLVEQHAPAAKLANSFGGKTAVLLGGGPSLDDMLPWLRDNQNAVVLVAVSRICRRLRQAKITPHLVVSIDPTELSFDISKEFLELDPRVVLAHANHVAFPLLAQWKGRSVFLDRRYPWACKDEPPNIQAAGPTVTNTAFVLTEAMGFTTVIFAGIDMCHSAEGFSHARGSDEFDAGPMFGMANMRVPTNSGRMAETTPDFFNAISAFGAQATAARRRGMRIVNPAADAAAIAGVEHEPLQDLVPDVVDGDPFDALHAVIGRYSPDQRRGNFAAMLKELARAHGQLRKIIALADDALAANEGLFGRAGRKADFRHKKRMDRIERQLDQRYADFSEIVRMFSARAFLHMPPSDREWTDDEIEAAGKTYYTAYRDNAGAILDLVERARRRIGTAISEDSDAPDFARMFAQWDRDAIPGRAQAWRHRHPQQAARLDGDLPARFAAMDAAFRSLLDRHDTGHAQKMRGEAALGPVRGKLQALFKERKAAEILNITEQLGKRPSAEARQLRSLAQGYAAEIGGDHDTAFTHYASLIDLAREQIGAENDESINPRLEDALRRMVVVALAEGWHDRALLVLETLAGMSPAYQPQFAEMLRLTGNPEAAAHVYSAYLGQVPGDHVTLLRLGKLYRNMGSLEAARTAFAYILEQDPDNQAARALLDSLGTAA